MAEEEYILKKGAPRAEAVQRLLAQSYWANERPLERTARSLENSDCLGVYLSGELVAFARVITDCATTYYICDVIVDEKHRSRGLGKKLVGAIATDIAYEGMMGLLLTRDAHGLYEGYGFVREPDGAMRRRPKSEE